jgi:hypothetical protein
VQIDDLKLVAVQLFRRFTLHRLNIRRTAAACRTAAFTSTSRQRHAGYQQSTDPSFPPCAHSNPSFQMDLSYTRCFMRVQYLYILLYSLSIVQSSKRRKIYAFDNPAAHGLVKMITNPIFDYFKKGLPR